MDKDQLKTKFETGDIPTEQDFTNLIDSCYNSPGSQSNVFVAGNNISFDTHETGITYINNGITKIEYINDVNINSIQNYQSLIYSGNTWVNDYIYEQYNYELDATIDDHVLILNNFIPMHIEKIITMSDNGTSNVEMYINADLLLDTQIFDYKSNNNLNTDLKLNDTLHFNLNSQGGGITRVYCTLLIKKIF